MRRNLFFAIVILLLALGIVWLFFCGTRGCDVSLIKGSTTTHQKPMDNIALSVSGKDRCIGSALLWFLCIIRESGLKSFSDVG